MKDFITILETSHGWIAVYMRWANTEYEPAYTTYLIFETKAGASLAARDWAQITGVEVHE